jgi:hypothetical protein
VLLEQTPETRSKEVVVIDDDDPQRILLDIAGGR